MHENAKTIQSFYEAFQRKDAEAMAACYHPDVHFSDAVFTDLRGAEAGDMWRMLCGRAKDLEVEFSGVEADDKTGKAHWDARYTFAATGRKVLNRIDARFVFEGGKILRHHDEFDLYAWMRQAMGPMGLLLGWTPILQGQVRKKAKQGLKDFQAKRAARG